MMPQSHRSSIVHATLGTSFQTQPLSVNLLNGRVVHCMSHHGLVLHVFYAFCAIPAFLCRFMRL
jgi:hypothetical protein